MDMKKYRYDGPVMNDDRCIQENWKGETMAVSEKRAKSNLLYRWKKQNGYAVQASISLPMSLIIVR